MEPGESFYPGQCTECHGEVEDEIAAGEHGGIAVENPGQARNCVACHDPHYQLTSNTRALGAFDPGQPVAGQCGACHEPKAALPELAGESESCMACHRRTSPDDPEHDERISRLCLHCHSESGDEAAALTGKYIGLIAPGDYKNVPHAGISCAVCHIDAAQYPHDAQKRGNCLECHHPHPEKVAHDPHLRVSCGACHLPGVRPVFDSRNDRVVWERATQPGEITRIHHMAVETGEKGCRSCHFEGNLVGAAAFLLPPKSVLCMPCHAATFSFGDTITLLALAVFLFGMVLSFSFILTGTIGGESGDRASGKIGAIFRETGKAVFSRRIFPILHALFWDVFLQRRLFRRSAERWSIHALIFLPFVFRFLWGMIGLLASRLAPEGGTAWILLDKNHPATAFLFDLTGVMILAGIALALIRGLYSDADRPKGTPPQDRVALLLIGALVLAGFLTEGARIAMTGRPIGAGYAFIGYPISFLFSGFPGGTVLFGYLWYFHAFLTGLFVAYLPFSRLFHIILAPVVLAAGAASDHAHGNDSPGRSR
jgi:nitrate reductase gamma subunit